MYMQKFEGEETTEHIIATLKVEKEELESSLNKEKLQSLQLQLELAEAKAQNSDLHKVISLGVTMGGYVVLFSVVKFGYSVV